MARAGSRLTPGDKDDAFGLAKLDSEVVRCRTCTVHDVVDILEPDDIDHITLESRCEVQLSPLINQRRINNVSRMALTEATCMESIPSLTTTGTCESWSDSLSRLVKT